MVKGCGRSLKSFPLQIVNRPMKTQTDVADVITEINVSSVSSPEKSLNCFKSNLNHFSHHLQAENGNYPNSAAPGQTNNNGVNNTTTQATVDVNANEKASTQASQSNSSSQQAAAAGGTTNPSANGPPPKAQRDRGNRGGGSGAMRNKKTMNPTTETAAKPSEKLVNGSS
jgi:hypothetical protein